MELGSEIIYNFIYCMQGFQDDGYFCSLLRYPCASCGSVRCCQQFGERTALIVLFRSTLLKELSSIGLCTC
jgi:hypothetical protein